MFEQVVSRPRVRVGKSVLVVGSAVVHAGFVAALMVAAMWRVERVPLGAFGPDITFQAPALPQGATELPAGKPQSVVRPRVVKVQMVTQPQVPRPDVIATSGPTGDPNLNTTGGGDGPPCRRATDPASDLPLCATTDLPPCADPPCSADGDPPKHEEPVVTKTLVIPNLPPTVAKGLRVAGDEQILPDRSTQLAMVHDGKTTVRGTFQLCVDDTGSIASVRRLASTGYQDYDAALMDGMRGWRYRPYQLESPPGSGLLTPAPMCTVQVFVYRIKD